MKRARPGRLILLAILLVPVVRPCCTGEAAPAFVSPQLFADERFFEEPDFAMGDLQMLLAAHPGRLDTRMVSCGGHTCTAGEAVYGAGHTYQYSLNVRLLLTLLELQSGLVTAPAPAPELIDKPFALEEPMGFEAQLHAVARRLVDAYRSYAPGVMIQFDDGSAFLVPLDTGPASYAVMAVLAELAPDRATWEAKVKAFAATFAALAPVEAKPVWPDMQLPGNGDPAFQHQPYAGGPRGTNSFFDHEYPDGTEDGSIVIYTGEKRYDADPWECTIGYSCYAGHPAYDYNSVNRDVVAAADGIVDLVYINYWEPWWQSCWAYYSPVNAMIIRHDPDGDNQYEFKTKYWHMASMGTNPATGQTWAVGDTIEQGAVIGPTGSTGCSTGPHLHYAVTRAGREFDPYGWGGAYADPWDPNYWLWAGSNASCPAETMIIESPSEGEDLQGIVVVVGWAINRLYGPGPGIDNVVLYLDGEAHEGEYLGEATYGDYRPDVGAAYGDPRFDYSGYHVDWDVTSLSAGEHTLYVYAHSVEHNNWIYHRRTVTVEPGDNSPPLPPAIDLPSGPGWYESFTHRQMPTFTWTPGTDPESGIATVCARVRRPPGDSLRTEECWPGESDPGQWQVPVALAEGPYLLDITATNGAGLSSSGTMEFTVDTRAPTPPSDIDAGCTDQNNGWQNTCNDPCFAWAGDNDQEGAGVLDYHLYWGPSEDGAPYFYEAGAAFDPPEFTPPGSCAIHYLNMAARDNLEQEPVSGPAFVLKYDDLPPAGASLLIDGGADTAKQVTVRLDIAATEPAGCSGLAAMRLSGDQTTWTDWLPYQESAAWVLPARSGQWLTITVELRDHAGNVASAEDSIFLDLAEPRTLAPALPWVAAVTPAEDGRFGVQAGELGLHFTNQITTILNLWAPGVAEVQLSREPEFLSSTWQTMVPTLTWDYLPDPAVITGTQIYARFRDDEGTIYGNYETTVLYDGVPPAGSATIRGISGGVATVGLDAGDENSGVYGVRLALEPEFIGADWQIYTPTLTTTLLVEDLLYVQFRDRAGNLSDVVTAREPYRFYVPLVILGP